MTKVLSFSSRLCIFHGNCADGFSAAWAMWKAHPEAEYYPGVYQKLPPDCTGKLVYLVDFSYKREVMEIIGREAAGVIVLDHHASAAKDLAGFRQFTPLDEAHAFSAIGEAAGADEPRVACHFDMDRSGAMITWNYFHPFKSPPPLLGHVQDRDLWKFELPNTREIQANVFSYEYNFPTWDQLMSADKVELLKMTVAGAAIERKHHKDVAELVGVCARFITIDGQSVPVASLPYTLTSDAGALMCQIYGTPFAACYWDTENTRVFSLRSLPEGADVSAIAVKYGGGGHKHASGFSVPRDHPLAQA